MNEQDFKLHVATSLGRIEEKLDGLAGPDGRVKKLEEAQTRHWWVTIVIAPFLAMFHAVLRHYKIDI